MVTGATGFIGTALVPALLARGWQVRAAVRSPGRTAAGDEVVVGSLGEAFDWAPALHGVDRVVHLAARVHVMQDSASDPLAEFRRANVAGTLALARAASDAGVRRFVFVSSIKVNGEGTREGVPFGADDPPAPVDPYGVSKREAEDALFDIGRSTGMEVVVVRPPLVYGPGVKANFEAMMRWLMRGVPLPLGAIRNRRTLVGLDNLVDLIATCLEHPAAAGEIFLAGDGEDLSTTDLLRRLAAALGARARLIPVPATLLEAAAALLGKRAVAQRLCGNLQVDIGKARRLLGWAPPVPVDEGLRRTAAHFLGQRRS
ncbi:UDP-glucose 4-epimerase family protein [Zeimonas arvi]|uniref:UDP-glucose 4-epimerase family protein n=1 Tax=Zeimonas arvi TaxID=2498847 RepID=UPI002265A072|nr:SDR family oxidoreductase [Zeimonas arvi]